MRLFSPASGPRFLQKLPSPYFFPPPARSYVIPYLVVNFWLVLITLLQHTHPGAAPPPPPCRHPPQPRVLPCPAHTRVVSPPPAQPTHIPTPPPTELPHYTDDEWDWLRGALSTVDRDYGPLLNTLHHHIQVGIGLAAAPRWLRQAPVRAGGRPVAGTLRGGAATGGAARRRRRRQPLPPTPAHHTTPSSLAQDTHVCHHLFSTMPHYHAQVGAGGGGRGGAGGAGQGWAPESALRRRQGAAGTRPAADRPSRRHLPAAGGDRGAQAHPGRVVQV